MPSLVLLAIAAALLASLLQSSLENSEVSVDRSERFEAKRAVNSVNRLTAQFIWSGYEATLGGGKASVVDMRAYLDNLGIANQAGVDPVPVEVVGQIGLPTNGREEFVLGDITVESVRVHRADEARATLLFVTTTGHGGPGDEKITDVQTDVFTLEPPRWEGLDFVLLANNINCIMCHTTVDDAFRVHEGNGVAGIGQFRRARVGSIESFQFRSDPDSVIAGSLYLGGPAIDEHGGLITDWSALSMRATELDAFGRILQDIVGATAITSMTPFGPATAIPYQNLYTNYLENTAQVDGVLPDTFPLPFRDDGGADMLTGDPSYAGEANRIVDDEEFFATTRSFAGALTGGRIGVAGPGVTITSAAEAQPLLDGNTASLGATTSGNVVLTGTDYDPIQITGNVAIDGDLIISGPITGHGSLWVRGNIYVKGDLTYADGVSGGNRQYGISSSGRENLLAMTAGGNVVIGDMFRPAWGNGAPSTGERTGTWNFTIEEMVQFNRNEWVKTQPRLRGRAQNVTVAAPTASTPDLEVVYRGPVTKPVGTGTFETVEVMERVDKGGLVDEYAPVKVSNGLPPPYTKVTTQWVPTGNQVWRSNWVSVGTGAFVEREIVTNVVVGHRERHTPIYDNANYEGTGYTPRYYSFAPDREVPIQTKGIVYDPATKIVTSPGNLVESWSDWRLSFGDPNDPTDPLLRSSTVQPAVISTLEPTGEWMTPEVLKGLIEASLAARDPDQPFQVDATVYSANSIYGLVPNDRSAGTTGGLRVHGSLLAADVGLLGPAGTELYYDPRGSRALDIRDEDRLGLRYIGTLPAPIL